MADSGNGQSQRKPVDVVDSGNGQSQKKSDGPSLQLSEVRLWKRQRYITEQEVACLQTMRKETDRAIRVAAWAWPEVLKEAVALRDEGLLPEAKLVANSGTSALDLQEGISPQGYAVAGGLQQPWQHQPRQVSGCKCFACKKPADVVIGGWWATEFEARVLIRDTGAELRLAGWFCGGCRWSCRSRADWERYCFNLRSSGRSRQIEIEWLTHAVLESTNIEWEVLFLWVEQE